MYFTRRSAIYWSVIQSVSHSVIRQSVSRSVIRSFSNQSVSRSVSRLVSQPGIMTSELGTLSPTDRCVPDRLLVSWRPGPSQSNNCPWAGTRNSSGLGTAPLRNSAGTGGSNRECRDAGVRFTVLDILAGQRGSWQFFLFFCSN